MGSLFAMSVAALLVVGAQFWYIMLVVAEMQHNYYYYIKEYNNSIKFYNKTKRIREWKNQIEIKL